MKFTAPCSLSTCINTSALVGDAGSAADTASGGAVSLGTESMAANPESSRCSSPGATTLTRRCAPEAEGSLGPAAWILDAGTANLSEPRNPMLFCEMYEICRGRKAGVCHARFATRPPQACVRGGRGGGVWNPNVYQKWPKSIFLFGNFILSHYPPRPLVITPVM